MFNQIIKQQIHNTTKHITCSRIPNFTIIWEQHSNNSINHPHGLSNVITTKFLKRINQWIENVRQVGHHQVKLYHLKPCFRGRIIKFTKQLHFRICRENIPWIICSNPQIKDNFNIRLSFTTTGNGDQDDINRCVIIKVNTCWTLCVPIKRMKISINKIRKRIIRVILTLKTTHTTFPIPTFTTRN